MLSIIRKKKACFFILRAASIVNVLADLNYIPHPLLKDGRATRIKDGRATRIPRNETSKPTIYVNLNNVHVNAQKHG